MNKKLITALFLFMSACSFSNLYGSVEGRKIQAVFNGEAAKPIKIYNISQDEYFSVREIAVVYGANLVWHPVTGKVTLFMNNRKLDIYIKSTKIFIGEKKKRLSLPTRFISNELYVPALFILSGDFAGFTGTTSDWNSDTGILTIEKKTNIAPPRFYSRNGSTQIVIEFSDGLSYSFTQKESRAVNISFPRGRLDETKIEPNDDTVRSIELKNNGRLAVVTIRLERPSLKVAKKLLTNPSRLVIDIGENLNGEPQIMEEIAVSNAAPAGVIVSSSAEIVPLLIENATWQAAETAQPEITAPAALPVAAQIAPQKRKLLVLDAGHGGQDPGAVGHNGTKEKDINLAIVKEIQRLFEEDSRSPYDVILTRNDDTFIPLVERTSLANEKNADLFVSVHCNADFEKSASGFEVYFLSEKASDEEAAATALLENSVVKLEGKPTKKRAKLQELLWSLMVNEFINESSQVCSFVANEVTKRIKIENRGVKQAEFYVLRGADMPAVLVECAFISHYGEEARLKNKRFQCTVADAVYEAVKKYDLKKTSMNGKNKKNGISGKQLAVQDNTK